MNLKMRKNESCDMVKKYGEEYEGDSKFVADCRKLQRCYNNRDELYSPIVACDNPQGSLEIGVGVS